MASRLHVYKGTQKYDELFNPEIYMVETYGSLASGECPFGTIKLNMLHKVLKDGNIKGKDLLEVGCGPSVIYSILPARYFDNVYLADYLERNINYIEAWRNNESPDDTFNIQPFFDYAGQLIGKGYTWPSGQEELRKKLREVWFCDIHDPQVLPPGAQPRKFDCITNSYLMHAACASNEELQSAIANLASLLHPGGLLITHATLGATFYIHGNKRLPEFCITEDSMVEAIKNTGLKIVSKEIEKVEAPKDVSDCQGVGIFVSVKS